MRRVGILVLTTFASGVAVLRPFRAAESAVPLLNDITTKSKITFVNRASHTSRKYLPESMVGGVAMIDYNADGFPDLFFVNGAALADPMPLSTEPEKAMRVTGIVSIATTGTALSLT